MQAAPGKVLRRRGGHGEPGVRQLVRFPPVELDNALGLHAPGFEVRADSERRHERHIALGEFADGRVIEMVVVIVRHDHEVYRRHRAKGNGHGLEALGAGEPRWRRAQSPDRIGEHTKAAIYDIFCDGDRSGSKCRNDRFADALGAPMTRPRFLSSSR